MAQAQWQEMFSAMLTNGVLAGQLNSYVVTVTSGLGISVASGKAMIQGFLARSDAAVALTCATADPTNPRIDRAVLHADLTAHALTVILLTGTPAPSPSPPALTQTATVWEVSLYQVRVNATQTTLTAGSLTDERLYSAPNIAAASLADALMTNQKVNRAGDTMTGSLTAFSLLTSNALFGSTAAAHLFLQTLQSGVTPFGMAVNTWDGAISRVPLSVGAQISSAPTWLDQLGVVKGVAGQTTAGSFGVPVIVAQALAVAITATTQQTVLSYTPTVAGTFRANLNIFYQNTVNQIPTAFLSYSDPDSLGGPTIPFVTPARVAGGGAPDAPVMMDGSGVAYSHGLSLPTFPIVFRASTAGAITIKYQDPGGVPADIITAILERLA